MRSKGRKEAAEPIPCFLEFTVKQGVNWMDNINRLRKTFRNPGTEYRSAPFWSWNDKLSPDELVRQIKEMKDKGMGGFFMHSRIGLETKYMEEEWMECVKASVDAAREEGMGAWIYDEDRWPSGAAGGLVPEKGQDAFRAKAITVEVAKKPEVNDNKIIALFRVERDGNSLLSCTKADAKAGAIAEGNGEFLVFRREISGPSEWFNDDAPADNLNPDAVKAFIDITYEAYKDKVGGEFGKAVPGIFTDEPNIADNRSVYPEDRGWIPWTDGLEEYFTERRGYSLLDNLPYIFCEGEKSTKIRHDYWRTISERFCEAYTRQLGEWCDNNNVAFTGHFLLENLMGCATNVSGSIMPHYRYQHVPGIDMLCEQTDETLTIKQCTSVANQYGRKRVLSELYGCTGWDFDFEGQKWVGDWHYVLGVSLRCQHLALYSLRGCRKRDYPPAFSYNTSWWKYNNVVEDYFARIAAVTTEGKAVRDILVLHPLSTGWSMLGASIKKMDRYKDPNIIKVNSFGESFNQFIKNILSTHYDFDLGDETIMSDSARIEGDKLFINQAAYSAIIIPAMQTMLSSTFDLLKRFIRAGGRIIAVEPVPAMLEGQNSDELSSFFKNTNITVINERAGLCNVLENNVPRKVSIRNVHRAEAGEFMYMQRDLGECQAFFVVNNDRNNSHAVEITLEGKGCVEEWNLLTGEIQEVPVELYDNKVSFDVDFGPADSKLYMVQKGKEPQIIDPLTKKRYKDYHEPRQAHAALGPVSGFTRTAPNALTLDKCRYRLNNGEWSPVMQVWQAQKEIRSALDMRQVYYNSIPQRYKWIEKPHHNDGAQVELVFQFNVADIPEKETYLVYELSKDYKFRLNGSALDSKPCGWYMDRTFDKIRLPELRSGINELVVSCRYMNRMELEDCYIIGDFGVDAGRNIVKEPETMHIGDWCLQGYFHYCGSMIYHYEFDYDAANGKAAFLNLGEFSAVNVEVKVNGHTAGNIPWRAARELDISGYLKTGSNKVDLEVMGSPRNLFGPFHEAVTSDMYTKCESFTKTGKDYTPDYVVKPYGLLSQINIYSETV